MQRVGILGGTFDPPHIGHLILGEYTAEALGLTRLLFIPAADPPHKQDRQKTSVEHRLAMVTIALADNPRFQLSRLDIDRPGPHYSVETVRLVQESYPDAEIFFVMGGDSLRDLPAWSRPQELIQLCRLAVMRRPGDNISAGMHEQLIPGLSERMVIIDAPVLEIASSDIIERIRQGKSVRYLVPDDVLAYIRTHRIYED
jgi:nicotinate-nucleotide adenylyltransferase